MVKNAYIVEIIALTARLMMMTTYSYALNAKNLLTLIQVVHAYLVVK